MKLLNRRSGLTAVLAGGLVFSGGGVGPSAPVDQLHESHTLCTLIALPYDSFTHVPAPRLPAIAHRGGATFQVTYSGFTPAAQAAFQYAVNIWAGLVLSPRTIRVSATFATLGSGILGSAGTTAIVRDFAGAPVSATWYGNGLADALSGTDLVPSQSFEISANFSNSFGWYYGTDGNPPAGQYDFVSVVLHELGHGLGFYGSGNVSSGTGQLGQSSFPYIYDRFAVTETGAALLTAFANPSVALGTQLTQSYSSSDPRGAGVYFSGTSTNAANGGLSARLYTVNPWNSGSSYSHLNEGTYAAGTADSLMTHAIGSAEAIHHPGNVTLGMFKDMGWSTCPAALNSTSATVGSGATSGSATVIIESGCVWAATSHSPFLTISSGASGVGNGTVGFTVAANNTGSARQGTLRISGVTYTVTQSATSTVPGAPTGVSGVRGNGQVTVSFTAPASNGGSAITGYTTTASPGGATATGSASPLVVTGLTNGLAYTFTVTATNAVGTSVASSASSAVTPAVTPATVPGAPTSVVGTRGNAQVSVAFSAPSSTGGATITGYTVTASPGGATATGSGSPLVVTGLTNGTAYTFTVTATNSAGTGAASLTSAVVIPATVPGAPTSVTAVAGDGNASVSFTPPSSNGGLGVTGYIVTAAPGGLIGAGAASPITMTGLTNGTAYTFTVAATNPVGTGAASSPSTAVTPVAPTPPSLAIAPATLRFSATKNGAAGAIVAQTGAQQVTVTIAGTPVGQWVATTSQPWLQLSNASGTGSGVFTVAIVNPGNVIGGATSLSGTIAIVAANTSKSTTVAVELAVRQETAGTQAPTGQVDTPSQNATGVQAAIAMTGWVVDDIGVQHVRVYRQCLSFDNPLTCQRVLGASVVLLGEASIVMGARPDVETLFPTVPAANSAGWGLLMLSNMLPNIPASNLSGGVGTFQLYAVATDVEGHQKLLGRAYTDTVPVPTTVSVANDTIAKPFGAIDTPGQGATVSGTLNSFGWALTPDSNTVADATDILVPTPGTTINVIIDGASVGTATYNLCRGTVGNPVPPAVLCDDDVSSIFRGVGRYRNLDAGRGAIGLRSIDTRTLSNGPHTIQWGVTDSAGRGEGIGSRYFTVLNASTARVVAEREQELAADARTTPVADVEMYGRTGFDFRRALVPVERVEGVATMRVPEMGRVELQIPGAKSVQLLANGEVRAAPIGMATHEADGVVTWSVGPGYLGTYRLRVDRSDDHVLVDVQVVPMMAAEQPVRMQLDRADVYGAAVVLHGWALDPHAETGSGIGAVHVWARQRGVTDASPVFLGLANLGTSRPDVAAAHGARFADAGFVFDAVLDVGEWDVTAYVWNVRTQRFEDARSVVVVIR